MGYAKRHGPDRRRAVILAVCCTSLFMTGLDTATVNVGLPSIGRSLHATVAGLQWIVAGYTIVLASLLMFSGALADRIGRRTVFQVGLALFTLGSWLCSLAPALGWLVAFRALEGIGGSMLGPSALSVITGTFTGPADRATAIGVWDGVLGLSMAFGPVLGGILIDAAGWRGIFWANIPVGLAAACLTALFVPDSRAAAPPSQDLSSPDLAGQVLVIVGLGSLVYAIIQAPSAGWLSPRILGCWSVTLAALAALLAWEPCRAEPLVDFRFFRSVPFTAASLTAVAASVALSGFLFLESLYLQDVRGYSALGAGAAMAPMPVVMAVCSPLAGRIVARRGSRLPLVVAGGALTLSCAALSRLSPGTGPVFLAGAYALFGVGAGMVNPAITNAVMSGVPKHRAGVASGMNSANRQLGRSLGVAAIGSMLAASLHGRLSAGFLPAARPAWWVMAGCGYLILLIGFVPAVTGPARHDSARRM